MIAAVLYEAIGTACCIYPSKELLSLAGKAITIFTERFSEKKFDLANLHNDSNSPNLVYLGTKSLWRLVQVDVAYCLNHENFIIDCLHHKDLSIRRMVWLFILWFISGDEISLLQTLGVLVAMSGQGNVEVIVEKLLDNLRDSEDEYFRRELIQNIVLLTER
jgi:hypothetical protein